MKPDILIDTWVRHDCTIGILTYNDFSCYTLELPWKENFPNVSCIPAGIYRVRKYHSPTKGWVLLFIDVFGRTFIEIHRGNFTREIRGCILVGKSITFLDDDSTPDVTHSGATMEKLLTLLTKKEAVVEIRRHY